MTDHKPADDLKEGFGLLFRAAKTWGKSLTPEKVEASFEAGAREVVKAVSTVGKAVGSELEKITTPSTPIPPGEPVPEPRRGDDTGPTSKIRVEMRDEDAAPSKDVKPTLP